MSEVIKSNELGREPTKLGDEAGRLDLYDGLSTPFSEDVIELSEQHIEQIEAYVLSASSLYGPADQPKEPTFVQEQIDVPSLIVRVDCTVLDGDIVAYEMEDSPSGQGITDTIHRSVGGVGIRDMLLSHYTTQLGTIPTVIVSGRRNHGTDDKLIVGDNRYIFDKNLDAQIDDNKLVIVKTIPGDISSQKEYIRLQRQAVAPLMSEGDKTYLERRGDIAQVLTIDQLLIDEEGELKSQVLKARLGSMAMGVSIYLTPTKRRQLTRAGTVTASKLRSTMREYIDARDGAFVQPFVDPLQFDNREKRTNAIMRVFVLIGKTNDEITAKAIGGCYVARQELIVHGASNAVSGAVIVASGGK